MVQNVCVEVEHLSLHTDPKGSTSQKVQQQHYATTQFYKKLTLYSLINKLTLSISCVKDIIGNKTLKL